MKKPTCKTCLYFEQVDVEPDQFFYPNGGTMRVCRRLPREESANKWCGEYIDKVTFKTFLEFMEGQVNKERKKLVRFQMPDLIFPGDDSWPVRDASVLYLCDSTRRFDDTTEEGAGALLHIPEWTREIRFEILSEAAEPPNSTLGAGVTPRLYFREDPFLPDTKWTPGLDMEFLHCGMGDSIFKEGNQTFTLAELGISKPGEFMMELTRNVLSRHNTLVGDWCLSGLAVEYRE